jgi:hypothetical protein
MARAKSDFFAPRGLDATLCTTEALYKIVGLLPEDTKPSRFPSIPFLSSRSASQVNLQPLDSTTMKMTVQERRLKAIESRVAPLTFDVLAPAPETTALRKICAWQVKRDHKSAEKRLLKARQRRCDRIGMPMTFSESAAHGVIGEDINRRSPSSGASSASNGSKSSKAVSTAKAVGVTALSMIVPLPHSFTQKHNPRPPRHEQRAARAQKRYEREISRGCNDGRASKRYETEIKKIDKRRDRDINREERRDGEEKSYQKILWVLVRNLDEVRAEREAAAMQGA